MGYACPVCSDPQADAGHLANHLAFSAMLGDADHEAWLEEHAPDWAEMGESDLAEIVADDVEETEFPQVFEDTTDRPDSAGDPLEERSGALFDDGQAHAGHLHEHDHDDSGAAGGIVDTSGPMDAETEAVLEEAREMTREMLADDGTDDEAEAEDESD